ncbi:hypothetical protein H6P81_016166 [Aristolochia fimbriata]|uniref:Retrotransposon gag protein n=1 Tax=Aristolochia fimbriata TaxID=158543 RepID=A0AAV7EAL1_ARIFI|nr:hypothetical protein H6P81_016166 [Aristolochia fimbriata]
MEDQHEEEGADKMMEHYVTSNPNAQRSTIVRPEVPNKFEIKPQILSMMQNNYQCGGLSNADPNEHIERFLELCDTFKFEDVTNEAVWLRLFPFILRDSAKSWLSTLPLDSIRTWDELQKKFLGRNQGTLPNNSETNPKEQFKAITLRSGKVLEEQKQPQVEEDKNNQQQDQEREEQDGRKEMLQHAKFLKEVLSGKRRIEELGTMMLTESCSAILKNQLPTKLKDPGSFTIPCEFENFKFNKVLCDLGAKNVQQEIRMKDSLEKCLAQSCTKEDDDPLMQQEVEQLEAEENKEEEKGAEIKAHLYLNSNPCLVL